MVRLTNHDRLQCREPEPLRFGHPTDEKLDDLAERMLKRQRGYLETRDGIRDTDPGLVRLRIQLRAEREVARYLMVPYRPTIDEHDRRFRLATAHDVPVGVLVRQRKVDPKGRASMPELLLPKEWQPMQGLAIVFVVWVGDGCALYLAGWVWEAKLRQKPASIIGSRVFHRCAVSKLHEMQRLVTASPYVPVRQTVMGREEEVR